MAYISDPFCRLCLETCGDYMEFIFNEETNLAANIKNVTSIEMNDLKGLPRYVCLLCTQKLYLALDFKNLCIQSNEKLMIKYVESLELDEEDDVKLDVYSKSDDFKSENNIIPDTFNLELEDKQNDKQKEIFSSFTDREPNNINNALVADKSEDKAVLKMKEQKQEYHAIIESNTHIEQSIISENEIKNNLQFEENNKIYCDIKPRISQDKEYKKTLAIKSRRRIRKMCPVCGKLFSDLLQHSKTHTTEKLYQCHFCNKRFRQYGNFKSHLNTHTGHKPYQCKLCDKAFATTNYLRSHMVTHTKERKYRCKICDKKFGYHYVLSQHIKSHTQEKNYICTFCDRPFINKHGLKKHERIHTGEKPYQCEFCSKCFTSSGNLTTHRRVHTKERPYVCKICAVDFSYSSALKLHMNSHSKDDYEIEFIDENI